MEEGKRVGVRRMRGEGTDQEDRNKNKRRIGGSEENRRKNGKGTGQERPGRKGK